MYHRRDPSVKERQYGLHKQEEDIKPLGHVDTWSAQQNRLQTSQVAANRMWLGSDVQRNLAK